MAKPKARREKITFMVPPEMKDMLELRASFNHRSLMQEVLFLVETGLATKSDTVRETLHLLYKASGDPFPIDVIPQG